MIEINVFLIVTNFYGLQHCYCFKNESHQFLIKLLRQSMQEVTLNNIYPELNIFKPNSLDNAAFGSLPFFQLFRNYISEKDIKTKIDKSKNCFQIIKVNKGTVLYAFDEIADRGFILLSGCIELLNKKTSREKLEQFPGHTANSLNEKIAFLHESYKIPKDKVESLLNVFYEQKVQFKYLHDRTIYNHQQLGFGEMVRNSTRFQTAISLDESQLLVIQKSDFDLVLRDFQGKKENILVDKVLQASAKKEIIEQIFQKMIHIMNNSYIIQLDSEDVLYEEGDNTKGFYFVLEGQIEIRKKQILEVPKRYMKNENKGPIRKEVLVKVSKLGQKSFIGEEEVFSFKKTRNFTVCCSLNDTLLLKIDENAFMKATNDFPYYERDMISNAVYKRTLAEQSFQKQMKKIRTSFINQYEEYDSKKKEKMLSNFLNDFEEKNQMFEVYAPEGVFFRDTFQKLEGFDESQKDPNKKHSIKRFKAKNLADQRNKDKPSPILSKNYQSIKNSPRLDKSRSFEKVDAQEKLLFSPKKTINAAELFGEAILEKSSFYDNQSSPVSPMKNDRKTEKEKKNRSPSLIRQYKSIGRFQQIQKDEAIFKRVLIKNGLYPKDKSIDKTKSVKPLVHHNFDEVIKQCISRKNQGIRRVDKQLQNQLIMQNYERTVKALKNSTGTNSQILKVSRFSTPCRGTEDMKKRMQSIHHLHSGRISDLSKNKIDKFGSPKIEECIGVNQKPKSSEINSRMYGTLPNSFHNKGPQKITLLNHMMKPITYYNSTEL